MARAYLDSAGPARRWIPLQGILVVIDGIIQASVPALLGFVTDRLIESPSKFIDEWMVSIVGFAIAITLVFYILAFTHHYLATKISTIVEVRMRLNLYRHLQTLSADFYHRNQVGEITSRLTNDITMGVRPLYGHFYGMLWAFSVFVPSLIGLGLINVPFMLLFLSLVGFWAGFYHLIIPHIRRLNREVGEETGHITANVTEQIAASSLTRAFSNEHRAYRSVDEQSGRFLSKALRTAKVTYLSGDVINTFNCLTAPLLMLCIGALFVGQGMTVGGLVAAFGYWNRASGPISVILGSITQIFSSLASFDRIMDFFQERPSVKDLDGAQPLKVVAGDIVLDNISFTYPAHGCEPAIKGLSLHIPAQSSVALIGSSGAGKSTLSHLILRLFDPQEGAVKIDGQNLRNVTQKSVRSHIGLVMQETIIMSGSVRENMALAKPEAKDDEIIQALQNAEAWGFVQSLPEGLDTMLGERGSRLSGGQKQRLAIARVFLKNPPIVIFDEATSALDTLTEKTIQTSMKRLFQGRTNIIIAHRLSTVIGCDNLVLMEEGSIKDQGHHQELLQRSETYQRMCKGQHLGEVDP